MLKSRKIQAAIQITKAICIKYGYSYEDFVRRFKPIYYGYELIKNI